MRGRRRREDVLAREHAVRVLAKVEVAGWDPLERSIGIYAQRGSRAGMKAATLLMDALRARLGRSVIGWEGTEGRTQGDVVALLRELIGGGKSATTVRRGGAKAGLFEGSVLSPLLAERAS